jgi:putative oxidoreductase
MNRVGQTIDILNRMAPVVLPSLARLVFAGVILTYFWASAVTKISPGLFGILTPSSGAYAQIFPKAFEAAGYDSSALSLFHWAVAVAGTVAEFILPALIVLGLLTRLAALGMIGFVIVQSLTDIWGHMAGPDTIGRWFDRIADAQIVDQRAFWVLLLSILFLHGAGPFSLDRLLTRGSSAAI